MCRCVTIMHYAHASTSSCSQDKCYNILFTSDWKVVVRNSDSYWKIFNLSCILWQWSIFWKLKVWLQSLQRFQIICFHKRVFVSGFPFVLDTLQHCHIIGLLSCVKELPVFSIKFTAVRGRIRLCPEITPICSNGRVFKFICLHL